MGFIEYFIFLLSVLKLKPPLTMNSKLLRTLCASLSVAVVLTGCNGLGKMIKKQKDINYSATPNPIEMHGDSVQFSVSGKFNPK